MSETLFEAYARNFYESMLLVAQQENPPDWVELTNGTLLYRHKGEEIEVKEANVFMCPLCKRVFTYSSIQEALDDDHLTREHVPPKSMEHDLLTLTCGDCNWSASSYELKTKLNLEEVLKWKEEGETEGWVNLGSEGDQTMGFIVIWDGEHLHFHPPNEEAREKLQEELENGNLELDGGKVKTPQVEERNVVFTVFKSAYLMAFYEFGYIYVNNIATIQVERQIQHPNEVIIPENACTDIPKDAIPSGYETPLIAICEKPFEAITVFFSLLINDEERYFMTLLPGPNSQDFYDQFKGRSIDKADLRWIAFRNLDFSHEHNFGAVQAHGPQYVYSVWDKYIRE